MVSRVDEWPFSNYQAVAGTLKEGLNDGSLVPDRFTTGQEYCDFVELRALEPPSGFGKYALEEI